MHVDIDLIVQTMRNTDREAVVVINDEFEFEALMTAMAESGYPRARGPEYSVMRTKPSIVAQGGLLAMSFYLSESADVVWGGFCWPDYYMERSGYVLVPTDKVFIDDDFDFDFDPATTLSILFGLD